MRKILLALGAAAVLSGSWVAEAAPADQPEARAFFSYSFGGHSRHQESLRYGLRMDMASSVYSPAYIQNANRFGDGLGLTQEVFEHPAAAKLEADLLGNATASLAGIPFAGRVVKVNDDDSSGGTPPPASSPGGFTWFDWTLVGVGLGGVGYLIAKATADKEDHN